MASGSETKVDTALLAATAETLTPLIRNLENIFEQFQQENGREMLLMISGIRQRN